jgi:hypothetical protein
MDYEKRKQLPCFYVNGLRPLGFPDTGLTSEILNPFRQFG